MNNCRHKRIKKNFPFGRKSSPRRSCKDCGKIITGKDLAEKRKSKRKEKKRYA